MNEHTLAIFTKGFVAGVLMSWLMLIAVTWGYCLARLGGQC